MKKIAMFLAATAVTVSANAQKSTITGHKAFDNIYVGVNAGARTSVKGYDKAIGGGAFGTYDPQFGIRVGKNYSTVVGLALEGQAYFNTHKSDCPTAEATTKKFVKDVNAYLLGTFNLMNLFAGYNGTPRTFEIIGVGGFGWGHNFGTGNEGSRTKVGLDFAVNFGSDKQWQIYAEPALVYNNGLNNFKFNINNAQFQGNIGLNYKFKTSNGTHNFAITELRDQNEIDGLNAKINSLRSEGDAVKSGNAAKDAKIAELQKALRDCENKPAAVAEKKSDRLAPTVLFKQGRSTVDNAQVKNVELIADYLKNNENAKIKISGYASPEGSAELNQKLSEKRAEAVKNILVKKYKISADRIETEGLGATDKLFDQVEFNRVTLFNNVK